MPAWIPLVKMGPKFRFIEFAELAPFTRDGWIKSIINIKQYQLQCAEIFK